MGYSHYVSRSKQTHNQKTWDEFVLNCIQLYQNMPTSRRYWIKDFLSSSFMDFPLLLSGCFKYNQPIFDKDQIYFNGCGSLKRIKDGKDWKDSDSDDLGHETFHLSRKCKLNEVDSCKTARKPYDLMVCACLVLYRFYFPKDVEISSDGDVKDWQPALDFIKRVLPEGKTVVLDFHMGEYLILDKN